MDTRVLPCVSAEWNSMGGDTAHQKLTHPSGAQGDDRILPAQTTEMRSTRQIEMPFTIHTGIDSFDLTDWAVESTRAAIYLPLRISFYSPNKFYSVTPVGLQTNRTPLECVR